LVALRRPVLGAILTFALNGGSISHGRQPTFGLFSRAGDPFLLAALVIGWVTTILRRYGQGHALCRGWDGSNPGRCWRHVALGTFQLLSRYGFFVDLGL